MRGLAVLLAFVAGCATQAAETTSPSSTAAAPVAENSAAQAVSPERNDAIERVFVRKTSDLQSCWTEEYERTKNRKLEGDVTVQVMVAPSGKPSEVKVLKSSFGSPALDNCVVKTVSTWNFPEGRATVPYMRTVHLGAEF